MKYLVYDSESDQLVALNAEPAGYLGVKDPSFLGGLVSVWHAPPIPVETVRHALQVLLARKGNFPFADINSAVTQIVANYPPDENAFLALGASPKMIKWILKKKGYNTVAISVSKITAKGEPTQEFEAYVKRKLEKVKRNSIVLLDFVNSGESMAVMKVYISKLWKGPVKAVALGVGTGFKPEGEYAKSIDFIVKGIPALSTGFEQNTYKQKLGRAKDMRDFATFPNPVKDGKVLDLQKKQFATIKPVFARAAELGPSDIDLRDLLDIAKSASHDSDDSLEEMDPMAQLDALGESGGSDFE